MRDFVRFGKKIIAVGRNYKSHILEMGGTLPKAPFYFLKPTTSYVEAPHPIQLPLGLDVHYEVELGVVIGKKGRFISIEQAMTFIDGQREGGLNLEPWAFFIFFHLLLGYCVALDLTARSLQSEAAAAGLPWTRAKGYDTFCPVSHFIPKIFVPNPHDLEIWLSINGQLKQKAKTSDMLFSIPTLISAISATMTLEEGDLILTGTPSGVGLLKPGDALVAGIDYDLVKMHFKTLTRIPPQGASSNPG